MPLNFPLGPEVGQQHQVGSYRWSWTGYGWATVISVQSGAGVSNLGALINESAASSIVDTGIDIFGGGVISIWEGEFPNSPEATTTSRKLGEAPLPDPVFVAGDEGGKRPNAWEVVCDDAGQIQWVLLEGPASQRLYIDLHPGSPSSMSITSDRPNNMVDPGDVVRFGGGNVFIRSSGFVAEFDMEVEATYDPISQLVGALTIDSLEVLDEGTFYVSSPDELEGSLTLHSLEVIEE